MITKEYKYEDIFQDIDDDPKNVLMNIPPEIIEKQGWKEGTRLKVEVGDQGTIIITELKDNQNA